MESLKSQQELVALLEALSVQREWLEVQAQPLPFSLPHIPEEQREFCALQQGCPLFVDLFPLFCFKQVF